MSEKLTEIRAAIGAERDMARVRSDWGVIATLDILLDMVCELERIEAAAQVGALSAFGASGASIEAAKRTSGNTPIGYEAGGDNIMIGQTKRVGPDPADNIQMGGLP